MAKTSNRWLILFVAALLMAPAAGRGQGDVHWTSYKMADGLPEPVFDAISFTPQGKLIAARFNAPLASELDGYSVSNFPAPAGNMGRICESPAGQRWALVRQGLMELKNGAWLLHPVPEIGAFFRSSVSRQGAPAILPVRQGCVLFLLPDGLREFLAENPAQPRTVLIRAAAQAGIGDFTGMAISREEGLWISGVHGLAKVAGPARNLDPQAAWQEFFPPRSLQLGNFSQPQPDNDGGISLVARSSASRQKAVAVFDGRDWSMFSAGGRNFFCAWRAPGQTAWAATANSLFQWNPARTNWVEHQEIPAGRIFDAAPEPGGAFWLATSDGLFRGAPPLWSKPETVSDLDSSVDCMALDGAGWLYFIAGDKLNMLRGDTHREYPIPSTIPGSQTAPRLFPLKDGSVLVDLGETAATNNALLEFKPASGSFGVVNPRNQTHSVKPLGLLPDGSVCLFNGGENPFFDSFDGDQFRLMSNPPPVSSDDTWTTLLATRDADLWVGGQRAVYWRHNDKWTRFASDDHATPEAIAAFVQMSDGKIWCHNPDELWQFDGKTWTLFPTRFNHINNLMQARDGTIWLASNGGLFRYCGGIWMENGEQEGLPNGAVNALCQDQQGQTWAGHAHGLAVFHPEADTDPPRTHVRWLGGDGNRSSEGETLSLWFEGRDKWKITPRERLLYSYQLDQQGWSAFQDANVVSFPDAAAGRHYFQVRAMDRNANVDPVSAALDFTVTTPWFRESRLWVILLLGLAAALFFAAVALNRHRQLLRSHAAVEQKVAERTRELEIATRELFHSQKMNALGTLAAGIAHDFNNILSIIKGSAQIIEDNTDSPEKIRTRVSRINTVVQQGAEIVDAMLGFGRGSDTAALPCDINAVVADTIKLLGDRFLREVEVEFERAEKLPEISAIRGFVQQILLNFIFNAAEAMSACKKITLATRLAEKPPPDIFLPAAAGASFVLISVQDRGAGMTPDIKARIFEPFFTTKALSTRRGTGLGLSMVYELAKKMGAGLAVQSAPGQGSTFTLILPVQAAPLPQKPAPVPAEPLHL